MKTATNKDNGFEISLVGKDFAKESVLEVLDTNRASAREIGPDNIFDFPDGILGFEGAKKYVLMLNEKARPFMFMQSLDTPDLSFVCIQTFMICSDFSINLPESCAKSLELTDPDDAMVISLVTVTPEPEDITANLMSPLVLNLKNMCGRQVVVSDSIYPVRYRIWDAIMASTVERKAV